jgi:putative kinase
MILRRAKKKFADFLVRWSADPYDKECMRSRISPSSVLNRRLALLKALLGAGWLGPSWPDGADSSAAESDRIRASDWAAMERRYGQLVNRLLPGLSHVCRPGVREADSRNVPNGAARCVAASDKSIDHTLCDPWLSPRDVPVATLHALREGMLVSHSGINTSCVITAGDLLNGIVPFLAWLYCLHDQRTGSPGGPQRSLVLLAAIPGAGKSVICSILEQLSRLLKDYPAVQSTGMDGWHLPNRAIQARTIRETSGRIVPMAARKGSPESFDVKRLTIDLQSLVSDPSPVRMPVYDRTLHEPIPEAVLICAPIVLIEGNYLLLQGQGWEKVGDLACGYAWLDVPLALAHQSMLDRHMVGGRSLEESENKWVTNDGPNALTALRSRGNADVVLHMDSARRMHFMHRP